jgi:LmbE family N-acetylglucosaminyl deacetylase
MLRISLDVEPDSVLRVLCLGAHSDDIEIGCGGTILQLIEEYPNLHIDWVVLGANKKVRADEAHASANKFLSDVGNKRIVIKGYRDSFFPYIGKEVKEYFEQLKGEVSPDLIFTHYRHDLHQDHRLVCELTWNTFRDDMILEYEIPKYDGDLGSPNLFVHLDQPICERKTNYLLDCFKSQEDKHWFTMETFLSLLRLRGIESRAPGGYAEGFYCRKLIL